MASSAQVATGNSRKGQKNRNLVAPLEEGATESANSILIEEKVAKSLSKSPPHENGGGCTPSA